MIFGTGNERVDTPTFAFAKDGATGRTSSTIANAIDRATVPAACASEVDFIPAEWLIDDEIHALTYAAPANRRRSKLFAITPLEWCLVGGLLFLLSMFALPALMPQVCSDKRGIADASIGPNGSISQAIDLFNFNTGRYPHSLDELMVIEDDDPDPGEWTGPYLRDEQGLVDPWGRAYKYACPGNHNVGGYDLWSVGPNGIDESRDGDSDDGDDFLNWD